MDPNEPIGELKEQKRECKAIKHQTMRCRNCGFETIGGSMHIKQRMEK